MSVRPDAVCWYEGMQLLPQHFQLQGLRAEAIATHLAQSANPWFWGVSQFTHDPAALVDGVLRVMSLEATLPDGLPVSIGPDHGGPLELDLAEAIAASPTLTVTVFLAVSPLWQGQRLASLDGRLQSADSEPVPNLVSGRDEERVTLWKPAPRLITDADKSDSVRLPLLRVRKEGGNYQALGDFMAPTAQIPPASELGQRILRLCARVREKAGSIGARLRDVELEGDQPQAQELRRKSAALWARLPEVEGALYSGITTPQALHGLLLGMAGSWAVLDPVNGVKSFVPLNFLDLFRGFDDVLAWLEQSLEKVREGMRALPFEQKGNTWELQLPAGVLNGPVLVGLRMPPGSPEQDAGLWLGRTIIASSGNIADLARQRRPGLAHTAVSRARQVGSGVGDDTRLFEISVGGPWFNPQLPLQIVSPGTGDTSRPWQVVLLIEDKDEQAG